MSSTGTTYALNAGAGSVSPTQWTHIALVRNGTTITIYLNGSSVYSGSFTGSIFNDTSLFTVGYRGTGSYYFNGYIYNFRAVNGTAVYTSNFTPQSSPLSAITNTALLTCINPRMIDNSTNAATISTAGSPKIQTFTPALDYVSSPYNPCIPTGAMKFNGSTSYLSTPNSSALQLGSNNFTIECWVYPTSFSTYNAVAGQANNTNSASNWDIIITSTGAIYFESYFGSTNNRIISSTNVVLNTWNHIAFVRIGTTLTGYLNGINVGTVVGTGSINTNTVAIDIGAQSSIQFFTGYISNFRIVNGTGVYTTNFTPPTTQLTSITNTALLTCQNGGIIDSSTNNAVISMTGIVYQSLNSPFSYSTSVLFNGSADYISTSSSLPAISSGNLFTIELWIYTNGNISSSSGSMLFGGAAGTLNLTLGAGSLTNQIAYSLSGTNILSGYTISPNTWTHIALSRTSTTSYIFINGILQGSVADSNSYSSATYSVGGLSGASLFSGYISNLRYVLGTALYTSNFTPSVAPLTSITNTKLLICQENYFVDNGLTGYALTVSGSPKITPYNPFSSPSTVGTHSGSLFLDGSTGYTTYTPISSSAGSGIFAAGKTFTIECWVYISTYQTTSSYFNTFLGDASGVSGSTNGWTVGTTSANLPVVYWNDGTAKQAAGSTALIVSQWNHVAFVSTAGVITIYVNGISQSLSGTTTITTPTSTTSSLVTGVDRAHYWGGYITNLRVDANVAHYSGNFTPPTTTLTQSPSSVLLLTGTNSGIIDSSGTSDVAIYGSITATTSTKKYGSKSLYFPGSSYVYIAGPANNPNYAFGSANFTIECWVYATTFSGTAGGPSLFDFRPPATTTGSYVNLSFNTSGQIFYYTTALAITGGTLSINTWYHVALCRSGTSTKLFINGTQSGSTYTDSISYATGANTPTIGYNVHSTTDYFYGYLDDIRITNGYARYTSNFTPPTTNLPIKG